SVTIAISTLSLHDALPISDFSDFIKKVHIQGTLINSYVDSKDIEYFAPSMQQVQFTTNIDQATFSGTVEPIKAQDVQLRTGKQRSEEHTSELQSRENLVCR